MKANNKKQKAYRANKNLHNGQQGENVLWFTQSAKGRKKESVTVMEKKMSKKEFMGRMDKLSRLKRDEYRKIKDLLKDCESGRQCFSADPPGGRKKS